MVKTYCGGPNTLLIVEFFVVKQITAWKREVMRNGGKLTYSNIDEKGARVLVIIEAKE